MEGEMINEVSANQNTKAREGISLSNGDNFAFSLAIALMFSCSQQLAVHLSALRHSLSLSLCMCMCMCMWTDDEIQVFWFLEPIQFHIIIQHRKQASSSKQ